MAVASTRRGVAAARQDAVRRGVEVSLGEAGRAGVLSTMFTSRALGLTGALGAREQVDYLSGLLIGAEIEVLRRRYGGFGEMPLALVGDELLCGRYRQALRIAGVLAAPVLQRASERGLWTIARQAGLLV